MDTVARETKCFDTVLRTNEFHTHTCKKTLAHLLFRMFGVILTHQTTILYVL